MASRSTKWSVAGMVAPLPIGAWGMRKAAVSSSTSAEVCSAIHASISGRRWPRCTNSLRSSVHSGLPTSAQKSSHC